MPWLNVTFAVKDSQLDSVSEHLERAGAQSVTVEDAGDKPLFDLLDGQQPVWDSSLVTGLFDAQHGVDEVLAKLSSAFAPDDLPECRVESLPEQDWERSWMDRFQPMQYGRDLWICPSWHEPPDPKATNIMLDPGLAFGTGTHPTTSLCLRWLDRNIRQQKTLLDFGCGSGILAIAACMLGIDQAHGVDIDPQALIATHDNAEANNVADRIRTWLPEDYDKEHADTQYDIVAANILSGPLTELSPTLAHHTKTGGDIVLSGILREQAESLLQAYNKFFDMDEPVFDEDWVMLHGIKR